MVSFVGEVALRCVERKRKREIEREGIR
jgi:hypothetical protein